MIKYILPLILIINISFAYKIALFTPHHDSDKFWNLFSSFMQSACNDLDIELDVYFADGSRGLMKKQIERAIKKGVDAVVFQNFKQAGESFVKVANELKTPAFLVNAKIDNLKPRDKYKYFIAQMLPDDELAGYLLAKELIRKARELKKEPKILAIGGIVSDMASIERIKGLKRALREENLTINRLVSGNWQSDVAKRKFLHLIKLYKDSNVIWCANDATALGVLDGVKEIDKKANRDIFVGGIDWTVEALGEIKAGNLTTTVGGHFMEGAWASILLFDYLHGIDFKNISMKSKMSVINSVNIDFFIDKLSSNFDYIDFSIFSKIKNRDLSIYNFGYDEVASQFK